MRTPTLMLASVALMAMTACSLPTANVQAGFANLSLDGNVGYVTGAATTSIDQDVESAFGLGDEQGSPVVRGQIDFGVPVLTVSGFQFEDEGQGTLNATFGSLTAGVLVDSTVDLQTARASYAFDIGIGPVSISPGIAVDYFDLSIKATNGLITEEVDLNGPLPLGFLRAQVDFGKVGAFVEAGYISADVDDVDGELLDIEAQLYVRPWSVLELFVGYRHLEMDLEGTIDDDSFDTDLTVSGLMFGGGVTF